MERELCRKEDVYITCPHCGYEGEHYAPLFLETVYCHKCDQEINITWHIEGRITVKVD